ncbi:MAG: hypothetical protein V2A74_10195 [bacterium]
MGRIVGLLAIIALILGLAYFYQDYRDKKATEEKARAEQQFEQARQAALQTPPPPFAGVPPGAVPSGPITREGGTLSNPLRNSIVEAAKTARVILQSVTMIKGDEARVVVSSQDRNAVTGFLDELVRLGAMRDFDDKGVRTSRDRQGRTTWQAEYVIRGK